MEIKYQFTSIGTCLSAAFVHLRLFLQLDEMSRVISFINDFGSVFFLYGSESLKFITTIYCIFKVFTYVMSSQRTVMIGKLILINCAV